MKNYIKIILMMSITILAKGQSHIKKQKFIEFGTGSYDKIYPNFSDNQAFYVKFGAYKKSLNSHSILLQYARKQPVIFDETSKNNAIVKVPVEQFIIGYRMDFKILHNYVNTCFLRGVWGANVGYESISRENEYVEDYKLSKKSDVIVGINLGIEAEFTPFIIGVAENINFVSNYQKFSTIPYIGFRFHFF